jgi:hypothetical protein
MNKQRQEAIRKKTWEYFIQQKLLEIGNVLVVILAFTLIPFIIGTMLKYVGIELCTEKIMLEDPMCSSWGLQHYFSIWAVGVIGSIVILVIVMIIGAIISAIIGWLQSNWDQAKAKARKEIR